MKLDELHNLMGAHGARARLVDVTAEAEAALTIAEAMGQRMVAVPTGFDMEGEAAECTCGLLLVELPRSTKIKRTVLVLGRARTVTYLLSHAHIAPGLCEECWQEDVPCGHHPALMCDTPEPVMCGACGDRPAPVGGQLCRACLVTQHGESEWEPDRYYRI
jgi:hypothetical protein